MSFGEDELAPEAALRLHKQRSAETIFHPLNLSQTGTGSQARPGRWPTGSPSGPRGWSGGSQAGHEGCSTESQAGHRGWSTGS